MRLLLTKNGGYINVDALVTIDPDPIDEDKCWILFGQQQHARSVGVPAEVLATEIQGMEPDEVLCLKEVVEAYQESLVVDSRHDDDPLQDPKTAVPPIFFEKGVEVRPTAPEGQKPTEMKFPAPPPPVGELDSSPLPEGGESPVRSVVDEALEATKRATESEDKE